MVRTIITPSDTALHFSIAKEHVGKTLKITYLPFDELQPKTVPQKTMKDFWNTIPDESAKRLHENVNKMRSEWVRDI